MPKPKPLIAIIDDDESMREAIKGFVRSLGYRVEGVGQMAIEKHDVSFKNGGPSLPPGVAWNPMTTLPPGRICRAQSSGSRM